MKITIETGEDTQGRGPFDVVLADGRRCDGLCFGEMLEQVIGLCAPLQKRFGIEAGPQHWYRMHTPEAWDNYRAELKARTHAALGDVQ